MNTLKAMRTASSHALVVCLASILATACSLPERGTSNEALPATGKPSIRAQNPTLEEHYALFRSKQIRNVSYQLSVDLLSEEMFSGVAQINFELMESDSPLTIDFSGGEVLRVEVNGKSAPYEYNGWYITISDQSLAKGMNQVQIDYSQHYSTDGAGLYRFIDSEDGRTYLYTNFEPYDANRLFPAFDQPDLKATYELDVMAPCNWEVISSVRESNVEKTGAVCQWAFPKSAQFSTYIFSLHAGEYFRWEDTTGNIPLRLFARQSLKDYVVPEDWFGFTQYGFDFFQQYFDIDYPYVKYDQIIVPDFNAGAMENVGAVTFSERYIKRGEYTQNDQDRINNVILHEMAHMWFGNLVTMRWWNGLWLNESFASYMSFLAEASDPDNNHVWMRFYLGLKLWAYETDQQVTTHPIELPVENSDSAFANFDGITYGKGASALKQLSFLLGDENFQRGIRSYLVEKSNSNSELDDFIGALATASNRDLENWSKQWLYEKGLNSVQANYQCTANQISSFWLEQTAPSDSPTIREHRLKIALFSDYQITHIEDVNLTTAQQPVDSLLGSPCPDFVYPNYDDWGFIKVRLSEREFQKLTTDIHRFEDVHVRAMLWVNLWEAVRDAQMPLSDYADILLRNISTETNLGILHRLFRTIDITYAYYFLFDDQGAEKAKVFGQHFEEIAWNQVSTSISTQNGDTQKAWFDSYVRNAHGTKALQRLADMLAGEVSVEGLALDQDKRWAMVEQLMTLDYENALQLAERESAKDSSDKGEKSFLAAKLAAPDLNEKAAFLAEIQNLQSPLTLAEKGEGMSSIFQSTQPEVGPALLGAVLAPLANIDEKAQQQFIRYYSRNLIRGYCKEESAEMLSSTITEHPDLSLGTTKALRIALQEDQRCLAIKALDMGSK